MFSRQKSLYGSGRWTTGRPSAPRPLSKPKGPSSFSRLRRRFQSSRGNHSIGKTLTSAPEILAERRPRPARGFWAKLKRAIILVIILTLALYTAYQLFFSGKLTLSSIEIFEDSNPQPDHVITRLLKKLEGDNLLLLDTQQLEAYLKSQYPYYAKLVVSKNLPSTLVISLETYPIVANATLNVTEGEKQEWQLSSAGQLQAATQTNPELPTVLIQVDQPGEEGQKVIEQDKLAFLLEARQTFEDKFGMKVLHAEYLPAAREVHLWTERHFKVWLDASGDLDTQLNKLKQALLRLNIYEESLEYVDLRIGGIQGEKVIYRRER